MIRHTFTHRVDNLSGNLEIQHLLRTWALANNHFFFRLSEFFFYLLLGHQDIGAGVEQLFGCLIVQNRQAV